MRRSYWGRQWPKNCLNINFRGLIDEIMPNFKQKRYFKTSAKGLGIIHNLSVPVKYQLLFPWTTLNRLILLIVLNWLPIYLNVSNYVEITVKNLIFVWLLITDLVSIIRFRSLTVKYVKCSPNASYKIIVLISIMFRFPGIFCKNWYA